jgi:type II secretory pathway component PulJ
MEDYSIIQGQTILELMIALLLTMVTSYVYVSCRNYAQRMNAAGPDKLKALRQLSTDVNRESFSALPCRRAAETQQSWISTWLAPIIVWVAVFWTLLAVVSILLGES